VVVDGKRQALRRATELINPTHTDYKRIVLVEVERSAMIRVCSGSDVATAGTNYLLGVATKTGKSLDWILRGDGI
jgi:glutamine synthetase